MGIMKANNVIDYRESQFFIFDSNGNLEIQKQVSPDTFIDPTKEEIVFVIDELKKQKNSPRIESMADILKRLKDLIDKNEITDIESLKKFIDGLNISLEDKNSLFRTYEKYLNKNVSIESTPLETYKNSILSYIRQSKPEDIYLVSSFEVISGVGNNLSCKHKLSTTSSSGSNVITEMTFPYNDELKTNLIEPVLCEIASISKVTAQKVENNDTSFGYRSNHHMTTENHCVSHITNIETEYANYLENEINKISQTYGLSTENPSNNNDLNKPMSLERKNPNVGSSSNILIYTIISLTLLAIFLAKLLAS